MRFHLLVFFTLACGLCGITRGQEYVRIGLSDFSEVESFNIQIVSGAYQWVDSKGMVLDTLTDPVSMSIRANLWEVRQDRLSSDARHSAFLRKFSITLHFGNSIGVVLARGTRLRSRKRPCS